jgi:cytochrome b pre-mRNA-processing protein 3
MLGLFRNKHDAAAAALYDAILAQARQPELFRDHGVPDTVEGRYDMMVLNAFLVIRRVSAVRDGGPALAQAAVDRFFAEMDRALREMGVGDLAVPKRMKSIAGLFAGCSLAYAEALAEPGEGALVAALLRNVFEGDPSHRADAEALALSVRATDRALAAASDADVMAGRIAPTRSALAETDVP